MPFSSAKLLCSRTNEQEKRKMSAINKPAQISLPAEAPAVESEWDKNWAAVTKNPFEFSAWYSSFLQYKTNAKAIRNNQQANGVSSQVQVEQVD
jgi:hypothetical protein